MTAPRTMSRASVVGLLVAVVLMLVAPLALDRINGAASTGGVTSVVSDPTP